MRLSTLLLSCGLAAAGGSTTALAQHDGDFVEPPPPRVVDITPEDTVRVERYIREEPEAPPVIEEHQTLRPGSIVPRGVPLQVFSRDTSLARYAYFLSVDNKIVVVDPRSRVVVRILKRNG